MELWIRSQNEKILKKASCLYLENTCHEMPMTGDWIILDDNIPLGTYKNYIRALEVFNEIQTSLLFSETELLKMTGKVENNIRTNNIVYTMPRE